MFGIFETKLLKRWVYPIVNVKRKIQYYKNVILNSQLKKDLNNNIVYHNKHKNKKCYIVGNGPSLRSQDISFLKNEIVFTVNDIMKSEIYNSLRPSYHIFSDPYTFKKSYLDMLEKGIVEAYKIDPNIEYFIPHNAKSPFKNKFSNLKINYFYQGLNFTRNNKKIDLTKMIYIGQNVVQTAIYLALYMGFSKICLLGTDMTGFLEFYESKVIKNDNPYGHVYSRDEKNKKELQKIIDSYDNEFYLKAYGKIFEIFKDVKILANSIYDVEIVNLTNGGALDVFRRKINNEI
jgi:hypothetical protein